MLINMTWDYLTVGGTEMGRIASDNSTSSLSQGSDLTQYSPSSPRTPMSFSPGYPAVNYAPESSMSQHSVPVQDVQSSYVLERHTPESLQWPPDTELATMYQFVVKKGCEPYLELLSQYPADNRTPQRVYLGDPKVSEKGMYPCQYPGRCARPRYETFKRIADLERHYNNVHNAATESYPCDYPRCTRSSDPFTRKDHYRDHLRDFHKEDLGSYKKPKDENWFSERQLNPNWWRCSRDLIRVQVKDNGYKCPGCKSCCDESRIEHREKVFGNNMTRASNTQWEVSTVSFQPPAECMSCGGAGWIALTNGLTETCSCQYQRYPYEEGTWSNSGYNMN